MKAFSQLYMDELYVLLSKVDIDVTFEDWNDPKNPDFNANGEPGFGITAQVGPQFMYSWGRSPQDALEDFCSIIIFMYEMYQEDAEKSGREQDYTFYRDSVNWWMDNFHLIKLSVPEGFEDMDDQLWEIWEEWNRKYDKHHIPYLLDSNYDEEPRDLIGREIIYGHKTKEDEEMDITWDKIADMFDGVQRDDTNNI